MSDDLRDCRGKFGPLNHLTTNKIILFLLIAAPRTEPGTVCHQRQPIESEYRERRLGRNRIPSGEHALETVWKYHVGIFVNTDYSKLSLALPIKREPYTDSIRHWTRSRSQNPPEEGGEERTTIYLPPQQIATAEEMASLALTEGAAPGGGSEP